MPDLRPIVEHAQVLTLLNEHFSAPVTDLESVDGGSVARVFAFRADDQEYIVRFNLDKMLTSNFPKEAYVWQKLAPTQIPMPPILQVGRLGDQHFAISCEMPGKTLMQHTLEENVRLFPQVVEILDAVHHVDVSDTQGYGVFNYRGKGMASRLDAMRFFAKSGQEQSYQTVCTRILQKIE
jgi:hygromycin-B 4-O-kinase